MAEHGMLGLFAGARGDRRQHLASAALASALAFALASALAAILTATSALTPPSPSPASAYPRGRPSSLWLASGYHQGAGLRMREHCARAARQRTEQSAAASSNTEKAKWPLDAFVVCVHEVCCRMIKICMSVRFYAYKLLSQP